MLTRSQSSAGRAASVERQPQQITQPTDHAVSGVRVGLHQRQDRVKGVEQKMGMEFRFEGLQPGLSQTRLQLGLARATRLGLSVITERIVEPDDGRIRHQQPIEVR